MDDIFTMVVSVGCRYPNSNFHKDLKFRSKKDVSLVLLFASVGTPPAQAQVAGYLQEMKYPSELPAPGAIDSGKQGNPVRSLLKMEKPNNFGSMERKEMLSAFTRSLDMDDFTIGMGCLIALAIFMSALGIYTGLKS